MSQLDARFVRQGYWIDHAKGSVMGKTITTDTSTGNIVIALLAVLTTLGVTHLWNLATFAHHQVRARSQSADGLFRQQQALLRTLPPPSALLSDWAKLWWVWRKRTNSASQRSLPMLAIALLFTAATVAVGVFSSYVVDGSNIHILVAGTSCGSLGGTEIDSSSASDASFDYLETTLQMASTYARDCYRNSTVLPDRCRIFVTPRLDIRQDRTDCPYAQSLCKNITHPAISFDSGLVDLINTLGINLPIRDRVRWRKKTTYSIVDIRNRSSVKVASSWPCFRQRTGRDAYEDEEVMTADLGVTLLNSEGCNDTSIISTSLLKSNISTDINVEVAQYWRSLPPQFTMFTPAQEMTSDNSDSELISIYMNGLIYDEEVNDPLYAAHVKQYVVDGYGNVEEYYRSDFPVIVIACQLQFQSCYMQSDNTENCSELSSLPPLTSQEQYSGMSEVQFELLRLLGDLNLFFDAAAAARRLLVKEIAGGSGYIRALPDDQWVKEVTWLEQNAWSAIQTGLTDHAKGYDTLVAPGTELPSNATSAGEQQLCSVQKMQSPGGFVNINVFALAFVITFCCIVTLLDMVLLKFLISWKRNRTDITPRLDAWIHDGVFQLQRRAYEAYGKGVWERLDKEVPATLDNAELTTFRSLRNPHCQDKAASEATPTGSES